MNFKTDNNESSNYNINCLAISSHLWKQHREKIVNSAWEYSLSARDALRLSSTDS